MRDDGYEACGTTRVDMRERIVAQMVDNPSYMAAIPLTVADLRAEGDDEGADELERLAARAKGRINTVNEPTIHAVRPDGASDASTLVRRASS